MAPCNSTMSRIGAKESSSIGHGGPGYGFPYVLIVYRSPSVEGHRSWGSNLAILFNFGEFLRYICSIYTSESY